MADIKDEKTAVYCYEDYTWPPEVPGITIVLAVRAEDGRYTLRQEVSGSTEGVVGLTPTELGELLQLVSQHLFEGETQIDRVEIIPGTGGEDLQ
jgi:hypothetical protein